MHQVLRDGCPWLVWWLVTRWGSEWQSPHRRQTTCQVWWKQALTCFDQYGEARDDVRNKYSWVVKKKLEKEKKNSSTAKIQEDHFDRPKPKGISESAQNSSDERSFKARTMLSENPVKNKTHQNNGGDQVEVDTIDSVLKRRKFRPRSRSRQKSRRYVSSFTISLATMWITKRLTWF